MFEGVEKLWQFAVTLIGAALSYIVFILKKDRDTVESLRNQSVKHEIEVSVVKEQIKHMLSKQDDIISMCERLEKSNNTILRALARKSRG